VYGSGIKGLRGSVGKAILFPEAVTRTIERIVSPLVFRMPSISGTISAIKITARDESLVISQK